MDLNCRAGASLAVYFGSATGAVALQQSAFIRVIRGNRGRAAAHPFISDEIRLSQTREKIDGSETKQEIGNKNRRSGIILCHSLTEKEAQDGKRGNDCSTEGNGGVVRDNN